MKSIYQITLPIESAKEGLKVKTKKEIRIYYDSKEIGLHRLDLVVEKQVIIEFKAVKDSADSHLAQLRSYLKATGLKVGLLLNLAKATLSPR